MSDSQNKLSLADLPVEVIYYLNRNFLDPRDTARLSQVSQQFFQQDLSGLAKRTALTIGLENIVVKVLDNLNHHDLYFLAKHDKNIAMEVVQTPELATKLNQRLWGDYLKTTQDGYKKEQYDPKNCLDKTLQRYNLDVPTPLVAIANAHPEVAELLASDNYDVIELDAKTNAVLKSMAPPKGPGGP
ncbi:hypothetical protein [Legionella spiritensis]|uniref:F-box domain-containing protein n=1 Tax=Legionella spiritensis TaxID=452 RepID=A0A0W0YXD9_LEGSP|nr:hypothetical protein [Legionella spiritensis]KTD61190.1 hypothetical protein Lspi_2810 [Legionella spiritensis]SNV28406.1 Uncharacterised protein [Legionella spiritensis]